MGGHSIALKAEAERGTPPALPPPKILPEAPEIGGIVAMEASPSLPSPPGPLQDYLSEEGKMRQQGTLRCVCDWRRVFQLNNAVH